MNPSEQLLAGEQNSEQGSNDIFEVLSEFKDYVIVRLDASGHIIEWNPGAANIYDFDAAEIIGKHVSALYSEKDTQSGEPLLHLKNAIENGRGMHEGWCRKKNGEAFYCSTTLTAFYNEAGAVKGFTQVTHDITLQKQLEEENKILTEQLEEKVRQRTRALEIANKELEAFSYSVSHDLRAPLRAINGYSTILKEDYGEKLDLEGNRIVDVIINNAIMMGNLIDDLLTFSKMSRLVVMTVDINMKQLAEDCVKELLQIEKRKDYQVTVKDLPESKGDAKMLRQVWMNLIGNSIKYSSKVSTPLIEIGAIARESDNIYFVKDNGAGFDMNYSNKLFGVFQRLHRHDEFDGTGLGLALAKRIISKHNGEIWAEGSVDKGATFFFSLPKK